MSLELLIIASIGLSVDVLIAVAYQGALLARISKRDMLLTALIFALWQFAALSAGTLITDIPLFVEKTEKVTDPWDKMAAILFLVIGIRFAVKAMDRKLFLEKRMDIRFKKINILAMLTSLDVLLAGIGFGFLQVSYLTVLIILEATTVVFVFLGMYWGYRLGYRQNKKIYWIGAALLIFTGSDILIRLG